MNSPMNALTIQLLEWISNHPRTYAEALDAWQTSCPRLSIWEDACIAGLIALSVLGFARSRFPHPGESGSRNNIRGPGYFGIDLALRKSWNVTEKSKLNFSWQVYNVTNSVRFDAANAFPTIDSAGSFGKYSNTLTRPRVLEFSLRYSF